MITITRDLNIGDTAQFFFVFPGNFCIDIIAIYQGIVEWEDEKFITIETEKYKKLLRFKYLTAVNIIKKEENQKIE